MPAIGAKECIYNLCFAFLDPGDVALASDPGYPVYTGGPILAGAEPALLPLQPELGFVPDLGAVPADVAARARLMFLNYPNNPTGATVPDGFFELVVSFAREHEILVVHDNAYSETTYDGYVAPSFLATPGAAEVGVEVFSLSKGFNMTGWRCAAILGNAEAIATYWRLKTNVDSGLFEAVQLAGAAALSGPRGPIERMNETYARRRDLVVGALRDIGVDVEAPEGDDLRLGARPGGPQLHLLLRAGAGGGGGRRLARLDVRAQRRGLLPHLADHAGRAADRGGRADAGAPGRLSAGVRPAPACAASGRARPTAARAGPPGSAPPRSLRRAPAPRAPGARANSSESVRAARSACSRRRRRTSSRWGPGSSTSPKWVSPSERGSQAATASSELSQASRSMSGGGVGGIT